MQRLSSFSMHPFLRSSRLVLWSGLALSCLASLANFGLLFLSGWLLAGAAAAGLGGIITQNMFNMTLPATGVRFFAIVRIIARYAERLVTHDAALRVTGTLRTWCFQTLVPRSENLATQTRSGDVLTRFVRDTEQLGQFPLDVWLPSLSSLLCSLIAVGVTSFFSPAGGCALAIGLLLGGLLLPWMIGSVTDRLSRQERYETTTLQSDILETLQGMADIIACQAAPRRLHHVIDRQQALDHLVLKQAFRANTIRQILPVLTVLCLVAILTFAARAMSAGTLSAPQLPMLGMGTLAAFEMVAPLMDARLAYERFRQASQRAGELCTLPIATPAPVEDKASPPPQPTLVLCDVSLRFDTQTVLKHVNFTLSPGERIAITGPSGTGKSTLVRLMTRLLDPDHGELRLNDLPLTQFTTERLSEQMGVLMQTPHLFQGSIKRNLLMALPQASENDMLQALQTVGLREEVLAMEDGLDTLCGEQGLRLSGGQTRRLAAAQIILRQPTILVLDEPTESLPPEAGTALIQQMLSVLPQASVLCITHRPEPLVFMHRVLTLQNGYLTAQGGDP